MEADAQRNSDVCNAFDVSGFPDFRLTDTEGNRIPFEANAERLIVWQAREAGPIKVTEQLLAWACDFWLQAEEPPTDAATVYALVDTLDQMGRTDEADALLERAINEGDADDEAQSALLTVRGLRRMLADDVEAGLSDLTDAFPGLTLAEAEGADDVPAFTVSSDGAELGAISAMVDPVTVARALSIAEADADVIASGDEVGDDEQIDYLAFHVATGTCEGADQVVAAVKERSDLSATESAAATYYAASAMLALGADAEEAYGYLGTVADVFAGEPFAVDALLAVRDHAQEAGDENAAQQAEDQIHAIFGQRIPKRLASRMQ